MSPWAFEELYRVHYQSYGSLRGVIGDIWGIEYRGDVLLGLKRACIYQQ